MKYNSRFKIDESLSVSDTVIKLTQGIKQYLLNKLPKDKKFSSSNYNAIFRKGMFNFDTEGMLHNIPFLKVKYIVYYLPDDTLIKNNVINLLCSANFEEKYIFLRLAMINNKPSATFDRSIQHEVNHIFQYDNGQSKDEDLYKKVVDVMHEGGNFERNIAYAIYLTFKTEQDSYASQYYAYLKQNNITYDNIKYDYPFDEDNPYSDFDTAFSFVEKYANRISDEMMIKNFGITKKQLFIRLDNAEKRLYNKITKALTRVTQEKWKNESITKTHISINPCRMNFLMESYHQGINEEENDLED